MVTGSHTNPPPGADVIERNEASEEQTPDVFGRQVRWSGDR
jgi:hypothetical protein